MTEARFIEIETKLAYQEDALQTLNEVILKQQKQIDQLDASVRLLIDRIKQMQAMESAEKPLDERPPHY